MKFKLFLFFTILLQSCVTDYNQVNKQLVKQERDTIILSRNKVINKIHVIKDTVDITTNVTDNINNDSLRFIDINDDNYIIQTKRDTYPTFIMFSYKQQDDDHTPSLVYSIKGYVVNLGYDIVYLDFDKQPFHKDVIIWQTQTFK